MYKSKINALSVYYVPGTILDIGDRLYPWPQRVCDMVELRLQVDQNIYFLNMSLLKAEKSS